MTKTVKEIEKKVEERIEDLEKQIDDHDSPQNWVLEEKKEELRSMLKWIQEEDTL